MSQTLQAAYAAKRKARRFAVRGIYEWQMTTLLSANVDEQKSLTQSK